MFIPGYRRTRSADAQLDRIERGVRIIMSQLDDLIGILQAVDGDVSTLLTKSQSLETQLSNLQASTPAEVDLSPVLDLARNIRQHLEGTASTTSTAVTSATSGSDEASTSDPNATSGSDSETATAETAGPTSSTDSSSSGSDSTASDQSTGTDIGSDSAVGTSDAAAGGTDGQSI